MKRILFTSLTLAVFFGSHHALAQAQDRNFLLPHRHFFLSDMPITLNFDTTDDTSIGTGVNTEVGLVMAAAATWQSVACTNITFQQGASADYSAPAADGVISVIFEGNCGDPGTLAFTTVGNYTSETETKNQRTWRRISEFDLVFCSGPNFATPAEIDAPGCVGEFDMQGIALHELGHGIGYGHTCEANESCGDPDLRGAVMYWAVGSCDGHQRAPNSYDLETHSIAYGLGATSTFNVQNGQGGLPLTATFTPAVIASASVLSVAWDYGDGTSEVTSGTGTHTYVSEGRYSVGAEITAEAAACGGEFTHKVRKTDAVIACNPLAAKFSFKRDGKRVKFYSDTLGAAAGCLQTLNWDFGDGATANVKNPIHEYATAGTYTVSLTASGPSGTSAPFTKDVKVSTGAGGAFGCSVGDVPSGNAAAAAGVLGLALAMSLATIRRRLY